MKTLENRGRHLLMAGALAAVSTLFGAAACSSPSEAPAAATEKCTPGVQISCPCAGGETGTQDCNAGGTGHGSCTGCGGSTAT
jgi:hypothetical protein